MKTKREIKKPEFIVVDLFCGAGGTTTGFCMSGGIAKVIACVNHDKNAIKSHWENNQEVVHFEEDIRILDLTGLMKVVVKFKSLYPSAKLILWASLECTNFSKAKGGLPRDADSRTLADELQRYIRILNPDIIQIENVVEFMAWGPLDGNGKPISKRNGSEWMRWRKEICDIGYVDEWRELNAADYGAYTSRNRLFGMFAKDRSFIFWPEPTHFKNPSSGNMFESGKKWKPVREVLDMNDEGNSIFGRKKDLSEKTLERIYAGLVKYVAGGEKNFIAKYFSGRPEGKVISCNGPAGTVKTKDGQSLISPVFMLKYNSINGKTGKHIPPSVDEPCPVVAAQNRLGIITPCFLTKYHGNSKSAHSVEEPSRTLATKDQISKVNVCFLDKNYSGRDNHQSLDKPCGTLMTRDKYSFVSAKFIMNTQYNNVGKDIDSPCPTLTASRRHHYLVNPQWGINSGSSVEKPCFTLIARMDKTPPYLVTTESGELVITVLNTDSTVMVKIKEFMASFGIIDIKMRMLKVNELLKIQGFPDGYKLVGTQTEHKKYIGNSVCPQVVSAWISAIYHNLKEIKAAA